MNERTVPVPPYHPWTQEVMIMDYLFHRFRIFLGTGNRQGENTLECPSFFKIFPREIVVFKYDAEIVTPLFIRYEDCRRRRRGSHVADR